MSISILEARFIFINNVILKDIHNKILNVVKLDIFVHQSFSKYFEGRSTEI